MDFSNFRAKYISINDCFNETHAFQKSCDKGNLEMAKELIRVFPDINVHEVHYMQYPCNNKPEFAFRWSCAGGHIEVAQWLKMICPSIDHSISDYEAFQNSLSGQMELTEWLVTLHDPHQAKDLLNISLRQRRYDVARYIIRYFDIDEVIVDSQYQNKCNKYISQSKPNIKSATKL